MKCKNLKAWEKSVELSSEIYIYFKELKDFGFKNQITHSSLSVPSNIAEGIERFSDKETIRFLDIAKGSIAELITQIYIGIKIKYIDKTTGERWIEELNHIGKMLSKIIKRIKTNDKRPTTNGCQGGI